MSSKRILFLDFLRIISVFSVIMIHVSAQNWYDIDVKSFEWNVFNIYDSFVRWGVPIYVMISGALFLGKERSIKRLYMKNIMNIFIKLFFWSILYGLWDFFVVKSFVSKIDLLNAFLSGHYHLWFLYMIIGLYMIVPFLNRIVENQKLAYYFILLSFIFSFLLPQIIDIIGLFNIEISHILNNMIFNTKMFFVLGYSGYFVLGYLLYNISIERKQEIIIYILGFFGFVITFSMTAFVSYLSSSPQILFYNNMSFNVLFVSIAVFVFAKKHMNNFNFKKKSLDRVLFISKCSFGAYLIHPFFIDVLDIYANINTLSHNPLFFVPLLSLLIFILSFLFSFIFNKIPIFNKIFI